MKEEERHCLTKDESSGHTQQQGEGCFRLLWVACVRHFSLPEHSGSGGSEAPAKCVAVPAPALPF